MVAGSSIQPRLIATFLGDSRFLPSKSTQSLQLLFRFNPGRGHVSMQMSRSFSGLTNLLFNRRTYSCIDCILDRVFYRRVSPPGRSTEESIDSKRKRLKPGKLSPTRPVPSHIPRPPYVKSKKPPGIASGPEVHDEKGIECMRASGKLAAQVLQYAGTLVKPGITTDEIDQAVHQMIIDNGAYPSPLGYGGFPKSVCTSVNECICHGIPDSRVLEDGDIINIDVTVYLNRVTLTVLETKMNIDAEVVSDSVKILGGFFNAFTYSTDCDVQGYHGDTSAAYFVGEVDEEARNLVKVTKECLDKAISICAPGVEFNKIGKTIHDHADKHHYGVVQQFVGHGVGRVFHSDPVVLHYRNNGRGRMVLNQTFTIEPMLTIGSINPIMWDDNWTVVTEDGSLSAQFEHTILITNDGAEILTQC
ncbi:hypothetical protein DH2020_050044 [Rehmannia glutinosa]|uniref:Peptidase M24 domain-containing protein n=1 Tax=Rehmannia glutinosa TaxID=99300 RepID=A0ABR0U177_REHGL